MLNDFKAFAMRGNVIDMANLFVVIKEGTPPSPYVSLEQAKAAGAVTMNYGLLINAIVSFVIVAFAVFLMIRGIESARRQPAALPDTKECPHCATAIPLKASRCPHCTSTLTT